MVTILALRLYKRSQACSNEPGESHHSPCPGSCVKQTALGVQSPQESPTSPGAVAFALCFTATPLWEEIREKCDHINRRGKRCVPSMAICQGPRLLCCKPLISPRADWVHVWDVVKRSSCCSSQASWVNAAAKVNTTLFSALDFALCGVRATFKRRRVLIDLF